MQQVTLNSTPGLRFPKYTDQLDLKPLSELVSLRKEKFNPASSLEHFKDIELESIGSGTGRLIKVFNSKDQKSIKNKFYTNDLLYGKLRPYLRKFYKASFNGVCSTEIWVMHPNENINHNYLYYLVQTNQFEKVVNIQFGSKMPRADWTLINSASFYIPQYEEQQKIAFFFTTTDEWIDNLTQQKKSLEEYRTVILQNIFSQKLRFRNEQGETYPNWEDRRLGDFLIQHKEKTTKNNQYPVLTSSQRGIYLQKDYFAGHDVASADTTGYNVVPRGYFTYRHMSDTLVFKFNINNIVDNGIVSTLYPVFKTKEINDKFLLIKLNDGEEFKKYALLQKQGGSRTYMYYAKLINLYINLPSLPEQNKIVDFITSIDDLILVKQKQIIKIREWKKGLMQQMFV